MYVAAGHTLLVTGVIDASGAGARAGGAAYAGGGGGGSGGGILLEAPNVEIDGVVGTNGGGGGAEGPGEDGSAIRAPALGGSDGDGGSGSDNDGVAGDGVPTSGLSGTGGGGGAGRIRVNALTSTISATAFSPSLRSGLATFGTLPCRDDA